MKECQFIKKKPYEKGNLYVQFNIEFPKTGFFKEKQLKELEKSLPPRRQPPKITEDLEEVKLEPFNPNDFKQKASQQQRTRNVYDEDNMEGEDSNGGQRVQCAQQ